MKKILIAGAALALAAVGVSGCASMPGALGGGTVDTKALQAILTDPACAHDDEAQLIAGAAGVPASFQVKVSRHCPATPQVQTPAPVAPAPAAAQ